MASPDPHANVQHTATTAQVEHGHGGGLFPPFDRSTFGPQLIWLALTFGVLYYVVSRHLLPRIERVIADRADGIRADLAEAEHLKSETEASLQKYEAALATARTNASGIAKTQRDALSAESDRERAAVDAAMARKIAESEAQVQASKAAALAAVDQVATDTVGDIVAKLTGQAISRDDVARAIAAAKAK